MKRVIRSISVRSKRDKCQVIGYGSSDRGTKIVVQAHEFDTKPLDKNQVSQKVTELIATMLEPQLAEAQGRLHLGSIGE